MSFFLEIIFVPFVLLFKGKKREKRRLLIITFLTGVLAPIFYFNVYSSFLWSGIFAYFILWFSSIMIDES